MWRGVYRGWVGVSADVLREPGGVTARAEIPTDPNTVLRDAVQVEVERFWAQRGSAEPCFTYSVDRK